MLFSPHTMSVLTHIQNRLRALLSPQAKRELRMYPVEEFETDVMDEINRLKQTINTMAQMMLIQEQEISTMKTELNQYIYGSQYNHCSVNQGNTTTINHNYYGTPPAGEGWHQAEAEATLYPSKGDYKAVVEWLERKKSKGEDFYAAAGFNRSKMCRKLSQIFGWEVDESGIRKAQMNV